MPYLRATCLLFALCCALAPRSAEAREIALSFDDAPVGDGRLYTGAKRTKVLIDALRQAKVAQAVFFVRTAGLLQQPDGKARIAKYVQAGHLLANHSHNHWSLNQTEVDAYLADIARAHRLLRGYRSFRRWYRFPFLHEGNTKDKRHRVLRALKSQGYRNGYVTVDNYEWYLDVLLQRALKAGRKINFDRLRALYVETLLGGVAFYDEIGRKTLGRSPRHVLLLHERDITARFVGDLVQALRAKGWAIIGPERAYRDPIATQNPDHLFYGQGQVAAIARAKKYRGPLVHVSEDERYLDKRFRQVVE
jgi:peptidoglycan/xylan/chitin deacetylase (PgdA/CDA1 family)